MFCITIRLRFNKMKNDPPFWKLLTPSWLSNVLGLFVGLVVVAGAIIMSHYQGSQLQQEIFEDHSQSAGTATGSYHTIINNISNNHVIGVAPLFILWAGVGLAVYYFAVNIVGALTNVLQLKHQLNYVNASRQALVRQAVTRLVVRLLALLAWFGFIKLSLDIVLPYVLSAAHAASPTLASPSNIAIALLAVIIMYADVHVHAVFLRLMALKPRLF